MTNPTSPPPAALERAFAEIKKDVLGLIEDNARLREALKLINGQCIDFEHGDDNLKAFVRGLGKHADTAIRAKAEGGEK